MPVVLVISGVMNLFKNLFNAVDFLPPKCTDLKKFAYNLRREILIRLVQEGYRVTLVAEFLSHTEELASIGCELIDVQTGRHGTSVVQDLRLFLKYFKILHNCRPDIVLSNNIKPNVYAGLACRLLRIEYIPNVTGLGTPVENPGPLQKLTTFLYKIGVGGASAVLFQNKENEQKLSCCPVPV